MHPSEPRTVSPSPLERALLAAAADAAPGRIVRLPVPPGRPGALLARWVYRNWLDGGAEWRPLLTLDPARLEGRPVAELLSVAEGGWCWLSDGWEAIPDLLVLARRYACRILVPGTPMEAAPEVWARLEAEDTLHVVATDPTLASTRASLGAHARSGSFIHLHGPPGVGKAALARWAWTRWGDQPLTLVGPGSPERPRPGRWTLFEDVWEIDPDARYWLQRRASEPPRASIGPDTRGQRPDIPAFAALRGDSTAWCGLLGEAARAARSAAPVLLLGEPGVGKELLARAIHEASGRSGAFEAVDVNALPRELVESELFGHTRGAFTGAIAERSGAFRRAEGGTLFLDELGNLDLPTQSKLLRVLQEKQVRPVGGERVVPVDVRIIAATNADLHGMAARGAFRPDLLHRVDALTLRVPPLRERTADILELARYFLAEARGDRPLPAAWITPDAAAALRGWPWEGNVRELWGVMQQAAAFTERGQVVELAHLPRVAPAQRAEPVLTTSSQDPPSTWDRRLVSRLLAVRLDVPSLSSRGALCIRNAILAELDGRPIRPDALAALERYDWPGQLPGLAADMAALRANVAGVVDLAVLRRVLPHLVPSPTPRIRVLLAPSRQPDGRLVGPEQSFVESAVVIGRASSLADLASLEDGQYARVAAARAATPRGEPGLLSLADHPRVSRAHLLLIRSPEGLDASTLAPAGLPVFARVLGADEWTPVRTNGTPIGRAAELQIRADGAAVVRLWVFADDAAFDLHAASLAVAPAAETVDSGDGSTALRGGRVWALDADERALLNGILLSCGGVDFTTHLRAGLLARRDDPAHTRLAAYLLRNRPAQYCARLYDFAENAALRRELCAALRATGDPDAVISRMPDQLASVVSRALHESPDTPE